MNCLWLRTAHDAAQVASAVLLDRVSLTPQLAGALQAERLPDELRRILQRGIVHAHLHLRDDRRHGSYGAGAPEGIFDGLLHHIPDPPRRRGDENAERQRAGHTTRALVAHELVADLGPVSVDDAQVPAIMREIDDRAEALARMAKLIVDGALLARRRESVSSQRNDGGLRNGCRHEIAGGS